MKISWVKRLGQWHIMGKDGCTICGKLMLGNNYSKAIPRHKRDKCAICWAYVTNEEVKD